MPIKNPASPILVVIKALTAALEADFLKFQKPISR